MKKVFSVIALFSMSAVNAQELKPCGTDEYSRDFFLSHPHLQTLMTEKREELKAFTKNYVEHHYGRRANDSLLIIPVVFHVIHNYGTENISEAQIMSGLKVLNQGFRKQLPDTANIVAAFKPIAADCEIEFRLARLDPNGNCTNGINRIASTLTNIGDHSVKNLIHWDPSKYLNIYVVRNIPNLAGHCLMPDQAASKPEWDGIVMSHQYVGDMGTSNKLRSVVLAHEAGHYLNLFHIWGGNNVPGYFYLPVAQASNCQVGDDVQDTPETQGWQSCNLNAASCGNVVDNVQNAMDYSYCNFMFTEGQKQRMRAALRSPVANRNNLVSQGNLLATGVLNFDTMCLADFSASTRIACVGENIFFTDKSLFDADEWEWDFGDGLSDNVQNPTYSYLQEGDYEVVLKAKKNGKFAMSAPMKIRVNRDNGNPFFVESFETAASMENTGLFNISDNSNLLFTLNSQTGYNSTKSAAIMMSDTAPGFSGRSVLYSPMLSLSSTGSPALVFDYAFSQKTLNNDDVLEVFFSNDCGKTWQSRSRRTGSVLRTIATAQQNPGYVPQDSTGWKRVSISIPQNFVNNRFMFRIEFTNHYGNNLFLDNININPQLFSSMDYVEINDLMLLPNPSNTHVQIKGDFEIAACKIFDVHGALVKTIHHHTPAESIEVSALPAGIYIVLLSENNRFGRLRMVKL